MVGRVDEDKFRGWLRRQGAQVLPATNQYEVARFLARGQTNVVYIGRRGMSAIGFAGECLLAYTKGVGINMGFTQKPRNSMMRMKLSLWERDHGLCFFCGVAVDIQQATVEHLVGRGKGGPDHQDNLALAHDACNKTAANLPLMEKIKVRERNLYGKHSDKTA